MNYGMPKAVEMLVALLVAMPYTDPIPQTDQKPVPKIVASPAAPVAEQPKPPPGSPVALDSGKFIWLTVENHVGPVTFKSSKQDKAFIPPDMPPKAIESDHHLGVKQGETGLPKWHKKPAANSQPCIGIDNGTVVIEAWGVLDGKAKQIAELTMQVGPAPPKPDEPKPIEPKPVVTSFRVFLIYESGATYSSAVNSVLYGNVVEEWLNANCTGGKAGWRRRDKDLSGDADPTMAAMWNAIKPNVTTIPCVGVEVNGKVELIPLEATPAAMVKKLESYKGAK